MKKNNNKKTKKQMGKSRTNYEENPKPKTEYEKINTRKILNQKMKISKRCIKRKKKCLNKVEKFCQQIR